MYQIDSQARILLREALGEANSAINQSIASDDQIIIDHLRSISRILTSVLHPGRGQKPNGATDWS